MSTEKHTLTDRIDTDAGGNWPDEYVHQYAWQEAENHGLTSDWIATITYEDCPDRDRDKHKLRVTS